MKKSTKGGRPTGKARKNHRDTGRRSAVPPLVELLDHVFVDVGNGDWCGASIYVWKPNREMMGPTICGKPKAAHVQEGI